VTIVTGSATVVWICGILCRNSTTKTIVVGNAGVGGSKASGNGWISTYSTKGLGAFNAITPHDLYDICLGINDATAGVTVADYVAAVTTIATDCLQNGDVILRDPIQSDPANASGATVALEAQYSAALDGVATALGCSRLPSYQVFPYSAGLYMDTWHPGPVRYADIADWIVQSIGFKS
jgi:hypothetical protein